MNQDAIQELYEQEDSYWWHRGRRIVIEALLRKFLAGQSGLKILDIGCGTGVNLALFQKFGTVFGVDASPDAVQYCRQRGFLNVQKGRAETLPFPDQTFDMVAAVELLEHMADDEKVLGEFLRVLKSGGRLFLTVPAYQFLWTEHDDALGHQRRYTLGGLRDKLQRSGFVIEKGTYMVCLTSPLFFYRLVKKLFRRNKREPKTSYVRVPNFLNKVLVFPFFLEAKIVQIGRLPFGTSIMLVARRAHASELDKQEFL